VSLTQTSSRRPVATAEPQHEAHIIIHAESLPTRCEICHQTDLFDGEKNFCARCAGITPPVDALAAPTRRIINSTQNISHANLLSYVIGLIIGAWIFLPIKLVKLLTLTARPADFYPELRHIARGIYGLINFTRMRNTAIGALIGIIVMVLLASPFSRGVPLIQLIAPAIIGLVIGSLLGASFDVDELNRHDRNND
jgi:hypothetical protein